MTFNPTILLWAIAFLFAALLTPTYGSEQLLPFEPVQYLKAQLCPTQPTPFTKLIAEATPIQAGQFITNAKALLKSHLENSGTSAVLIKGKRVMVQRRAKELQWDSEIILPYSNTISLISSVLPILLEGYKASTITDPIGKVLKGKDLNHPLITGQESLTFLDIINKLPSGGKTVNLDSSSLLSSLLANGELSLHFVNAILDNTAHEAWMDALMAIGDNDIQRNTNGQLTLNLNSLLQFSLAISHDLNRIGVASKKERIPLDDNKYLFGWWFNCPKESTTNCLIPSAPKDTIFSLSPDLRLYVTPSLELTLIVLGPGASSNTADNTGKILNSIADILLEDSDIWRQLTSAVDTSNDQSTPQSKIPSEATATQTPKADKPTPEIDNSNVLIESTENSMEDVVNDLSEGGGLIPFIHWSWPMIVFLFWVTFSHLWIYWMLHIFWLFLTSVSKRAHIPRPKTAAETTN